MKKIVFLALIAIGFVSCKSGNAATNTASKEINNSKKTINSILKTAEGNLGVKYKYAGITKAGFDCSGLVFTSFQSEAINLPRSSYEQARIGKVIPIQQCQKGDLLFFKTDRSSKINHVGIITEINSEEIKFIHSSTSKGVIISSMKETYYKNSFVQANRIIN